MLDFTRSAFGIFMVIFFPLQSFAQDAVAEGDKLFVLMKYQEAITQYSKAPQSAEAQWKIARAYICQSDLVAKDQKKTYVIPAEKAARKSITLDPDKSEGHTWLAASLGNRAMYEGSKSKVLLCNEIKKELETAIKLNPKDDIAYSIFGTFYRALGNISWVEKELADIFLGKLPPGGFAEGEVALKKAIELSPTTVRHWYELGKLYEAWGKDLSAKITFTQGVKLELQVASDKKRIKEMNDYLNKD